MTVPPPLPQRLLQLMDHNLEFKEILVGQTMWTRESVGAQTMLCRLYSIPEDSS